MSGNYPEKPAGYDSTPGVISPEKPAGYDSTPGVISPPPEGYAPGYAPPPGGYAPPVGGYAPDYAPPPGGYTLPTGGYAPPPGGYAPPPGGYAPPAAGYAPGYAPPPGGYAPPTGGYAPPTGGYAPPTGGYAPPTGGYAPPAAGYAPGYALPPAGYAPPPAGYPQPAPLFVAPGGASYPQPAPDRPPKEHCFYLKSNMSQMVMEVEKGNIDPGTRVVMATYNGQGQDGQLWFEDHNTGTIKSRLSLLCLDVQDQKQPYHVMKSPRSLPPHTVCLSNQGGQPHYNAVAHTKWGSIPGKALLKQCWYPYGGNEYCTSDFSWVVAQTARLVRNTGSEPSGTLDVGHQNDDGNTYYAAVARSQWGTIPGKARGNTCWFTYGMKEHYTKDFDWIIAEKNFVVVNPHMPGKQTQLWQRVGTAIQNRQTPSTVLQHCDGSRESLVFSTVSKVDPRQQWTFPKHGMPAPPDYKTIVQPAPVQRRRRHFFIRSEMHNKVLDVEGGNTKAGAMVIMFPKKSPPTANQLWYTDEQDIFRSKMTDFCLQPSGHGIWLQPFANKPDQMWTISGNRIALKSNPQMCLDIQGEDRNDCAKLCQCQYKDGTNQHWALDYVD